jgi:pSer/pThr/pTyr-binding forkhead associated (FHA) protein
MASRTTSRFVVEGASERTVEGTTERVDAIACLDDSVRRSARAPKPLEPGRYIELEGREETLLIPLGRGVTHIGRGLSADLRLDENSVSRRHAIIVQRPTGPRILDDRSSNGTFVNGRRVAQARLNDGDVIALGRVLMRYLEV